MQFVSVYHFHGSGTMKKMFVIFQVCFRYLSCILFVVLGQPPKGSFQYYEWLKKTKKSKLNKIAYKSSSSTNKKREMENEKHSKFKQRRKIYMVNYRKDKKKEPGTKTKTPSMTITFKNRMEKSRSLRKLKDSLPESSRLKTATLRAYLNSDSPTAQSLQHEQTMQRKQSNLIQENIVDNIKSAINATKKRRSKEAVSCRRVLFSSISGENISQDNQTSTQLADTLNVRTSTLKQAGKERDTILEGKMSTIYRKQNKITDEQKLCIKSFWLSSGVSRPTGNKRDMRRERLDQNVYAMRPLQILEMSQKEAFQKFKEEHPEIDISLRTFESLKPSNVRHVREKDRETCMCRYHVEFETVLKYCMKRRKLLDVEKKYTHYNTITELNDASLCPKEGKFHKQDCVTRNCDTCGTKNIELMESEMSDEIVEWERYEYVQIKSKGMFTIFLFILITPRKFRLFTIRRK